MKELNFTKTVFIHIVDTIKRDYLNQATLFKKFRRSLQNYLKKTKNLKKL